MGLTDWRHGTLPVRIDRRSILVNYATSN